MYNFSSVINNLDTFLVCGLGSLGQNCVIALKEFGVKVIAIEQTAEIPWELKKVPELLDDLIIGDCRDLAILQKAKIKDCRSILIVTSDEEVNVETAINAREINSKIRIIMRSCQEKLNDLLSKQLGNFFADEPAHLTALAFALAGLGNETIGILNLAGQRLQIIQRQLKPTDNWCYNRKVHELNTQKRIVLGHYSLAVSLKYNFHQWDSEVVLHPGDTIIYIEMVDKFSLGYSPPVKKKSRLVNFLQTFQGEIKQFTQFKFIRKVRSVAIVASLTIIFLLFLGTFLFAKYYVGTNWLYAFYATAILLLGGYADLFGDLEPNPEILPWLQLFALSLTIIGTVFVGLLYALITDNLLSSKFELILNRPPIPKEQHLVLVGLGKVGQRVANLLQELKESLVAISFEDNINRANLPNIPIVIGNFQEALTQANIPQAKSVIITTNNPMLNLEIALTIRNLNPSSNLVIGTYQTGVSYQLTRLLDNTQVIGTYTVAAEAFAGAAFGENILALFRQNNQTILTTEYQIEANDTLNGLLISEINYGYGVVVIFYQTPNQEPLFIPLEDLRVSSGDRIIVLATIEGLRTIERGNIDIISRCWQVHLEKALTQDAIFDGANIISRITGCPIPLARELVNNLPQTIPIPLYQHQAERLVRDLKKALVNAYLENIS
ncbi:MAG: potassium transporter TrkA [Gloeocapsa sp. DLM2.Bin57]|nr:MAG: potassium transporter TrkA [Gloeocapsa sp. DLM2.Bin57]